jgi:hypothetical protein
MSGCQLSMRTCTLVHELLSRGEKATFVASAGLDFSAHE